jgi:hypothetical protein
MATAVSLAGTLTLDSGGDSAAVWIFQIGGTLTTAADSPEVDRKRSWLFLYRLSR